MTFGHYLKDRVLFLGIWIGTLLVLFLLFLAFKVSKELMIAVFFLLSIPLLFSLLGDYFRKKGFYQNLLVNISLLDRGYLVLETLEKPNFYEGELLFQALYDINKSMNEYVKNYEEQMNDFKDYIEMWIHEVKIPIASFMLFAHNHKNVEKKAIEQVKRIENDVEQALYYVRSENAERDYLIKEVDLSLVIQEVAMKNKDDLLEHKIDLRVDDIECQIYTDSKWLVFILNQIFQNAIKYRREDVSSYIKVSVFEKENDTVLVIEDNGIGIPLSDLPKVFDKSFTGYNGRIKAKSTGMGLYIAKKLCEKLGHHIEIDSKEGEYTKVLFTFSRNPYFDVLK